MSKHELPQNVIRFYGNPNYALECIALKQITFIHVDKLNDPFDPTLDFLTDFDNNYAALLSYAEKQYPSKLAVFKAKLPERNWNEVVTGWSNLASATRAGMFVFSTCAVREGNHPRDSLYMWGHYGNGHRGVAIEFNAIALVELFTKQTPLNETPWWKMDYRKEVPKIKCEDIVETVINAKPNAGNLEAYGPNLSSIIYERLHSKGEVWRNEDEWRLAWRNDETKLRVHRLGIPSSAITAVYLGCRAAEQKQLRNDFVSETRRHFPNANVFRANMRPGEYALDFEKIA